MASHARVCMVSSCVAWVVRGPAKAWNEHRARKAPRRRASDPQRRRGVHWPLGRRTARYTDFERGRGQIERRPGRGEDDGIGSRPGHGAGRESVIRAAGSISRLDARFLLAARVVVRLVGRRRRRRTQARHDQAGCGGQQQHRCRHRVLRDGARAAHEDDRPLSNKRADTSQRFSQYRRKRLRDLRVWRAGLAP